MIADKVCGLTVAYAVFAALVRRAAIGEGADIEVPMGGVLTSFMLVEHSAGATPVPPLGRAGCHRIMAPHRRHRDVADGLVYVMLYTEELWRAVLTLGEYTDLITPIGCPRSRAGTLIPTSSTALYSRSGQDWTVEQWLAFC